MEKYSEINAKCMYNNLLRSKGNNKLKWFSSQSLGKEIKTIIEKLNSVFIIIKSNNIIVELIWKKLYQNEEKFG